MAKMLYGVFAKLEGSTREHFVLMTNKRLATQHARHFNGIAASHVDIPEVKSWDGPTFKAGATVIADFRPASERPVHSLTRAEMIAEIIAADIDSWNDDPESLKDDVAAWLKGEMTFKPYTRYPTSQLRVTVCELRREEPKTVDDIVKGRG